MMKKKRQFHCEKCGSPCEIYKKGKKHRVLVCPKCGVIATNPLPLMAGALALKGVKAGASMLGIGGKSKDTEKPTTQKIININRDEFDTEERVTLALK